ncbi:MAG TPA: bifunctional phosphoribosyl-AMP cyclohydrolase/phosphoribosyl-ATP diphosphatase HisIE [Vicinamibacteria bacterium]|nr:bifunctional phosphoribosyl-AMP cyclohydrolase/phosphoribosyl-ATP diphosphatase HisIE [Vicinamibacteria bacterium]
MTLEMPDPIRFDAAGLVPVVVQDHASGDVLMVAWANGAALELTQRTGLAHFWSRRRGGLWKKGETSGHLLHVREVRGDCDGDTLLMVADPQGPACHTGERTCFGSDTPTAAGRIEALARTIALRARTRPEGSYTSRLLGKGLDHTLKKVGEEATEVVLAAKGESDERLAEECADLVFHLLVVLEQRGVRPRAVFDVLRERAGEGR